MIIDIRSAKHSSTQDVFTKDGEEFTTFVDQNNEKRTLRSDLIEVPTFTMD
jgi:hypothetical protein